MSEQWRDERREAVESLRSAHDALVAAEVAEVEWILRLCDLYAGHRCSGNSDEDDFLMLAERFLPGGSEGTPTVSEFLCLEVGGTLGISPEAAAHRIHQALDLRHRMPHLWHAVQHLEIRVWQANKLAEATQHLGAEAAAWVDRHLRLAYPTMAFPRLRKLAAGLIVKADPALAAERAAEHRRDRHVRVQADSASGTAWLVARLDLADALRLKATCDSLAEALALAGDESTLDRRRASALGMLGDPATAAAVLSGDALPSSTAPSGAQLIVHLSPDSLADPESGVARVEGLGPMLVTHLGDLLRHHTRIALLPVLDPEGLAPADSYEIPERLRQAVLLRSPVDSFPHGRRTARSCDLDHTQPFAFGPGAPPGQTRLGNLAPLSRRSHRGKTHGGWTVTQLDGGYLHWVSPLGFGYLTGPFGTVDAPESLVETTLALALAA